MICSIDDLNEYIYHLYSLDIKFSVYVDKESELDIVSEIKERISEDISDCLLLQHNIECCKTMSDILKCIGFNIKDVVVNDDIYITCDKFRYVFIESITYKVLEYLLEYIEPYSYITIGLSDKYTLFKLCFNTTWESKLVKQIPQISWV